MPDCSPRHMRCASRTAVEASSPLSPLSSFAVRQAGESRATPSPAVSLDAAIRLGHSFGAGVLSSPPGIQPKLKVGATHDKYEQEADRIAFQAINGARGHQEGAESVRKPVVDPVTPMAAPPSIQRSGDAHSGEAFEADGAFQDQLDRIRGGGIPLDTRTREFLEPSMGGDFSQVRVHRDPEAKQLNRELNSAAFTHGSDIYMGEAGFAPGSIEETHLFAHELTHVMQQAQAGVSQAGSLPIQRFSQASLDNGTWVHETARVKRPPQGLSGGVYFFESDDGDIRDLVVKPERGSSQGAVLMAEIFLSEAMDIAVSETKKTVFNNSPEANSIKSTIDQKYIATLGDPITENNLRTSLNNAALFLIQSKVPGTSISSLTEKATDPGKVDLLVARLSDQNTLLEIGQLIVGDAFIGNVDRVSANIANLGNIMVSSNGVIAIDNAAWFYEVIHPPISPTAITAHHFDMITDIYENPQAIIDYFFRGVRSGLRTASNVNFDAWADFQGKYDFDAALFGIRLGIKQGVDKLGVVLTGRKQTRAELKRLGKFGQEEAHWDAFRVREEYIKLLRQGVPSVAAQKTIKQYYKYRAKRRALPKGLRFLAKVHKPSLPA